MEQQRYFVINEQELSTMMQDAARVGATTALEKLGEERERERKAVSRKRLHNTELLMKNYRILKAHSGQSIFEASRMEESAADILISMMSLKDDDMVVESIKRSAERTAIMMAHVDGMLSLYRNWCEGSANDLDLRRYDILRCIYLDEEVMTVKELADFYNISKESVYSDKNLAVKQLSSLLFGIDALK